MRKPTKQDLWLLLFAAISFIGMGIGLGRCSKKTIIQSESVDISRYQRVIDSVKFAHKKDSVVISYMESIVDSLNKQLKDKNQLTHETNQIKNFTPTTRSLWNDSVLKSAGLR